MPPLKERNDAKEGMKSFRCRKWYELSFKSIIQEVKERSLTYGVFLLSGFRNCFSFDEVDTFWNFVDFF